MEVIVGRGHETSTAPTKGAGQEGQLFLFEMFIIRLRYCVQLDTPLVQNHAVVAEYLMLLQSLVLVPQYTVHVECFMSLLQSLVLLLKKRDVEELVLFLQSASCCCCCRAWCCC